MDPVVTIIIVLIVAILAGLVGFFYVAYVNSREPEVQRKWTDPKFRDHISNKQ